MNLIQNRLKRALIIVAAVLIVVCSWYPPIQSLAEAQVDDGLKRALISFASARTLNALISVLQGTEMSMQPLGVGLTLTLGQALDPINDLVEQFSSLMLFASVAFGVQKALLAVGANWLVSLLVSATAIVWAGLSLIKKSPFWLTRLFLVLLLIRFAIPVVTIGSDFFYQQLLAEDYVEQQKSIDAVSVEIAKAAPQLPANGSVDAKVTPAAPVNGTEPPSEEQSAPATEMGWFGKLTDQVLPGTPSVEAPSTNLPANTPQKSWMERLKERFSSAMPNVNLDYDSIKKTLENLPERIVKVIVIFLLQTMIIPIVLLWALYKIAMGVVRPEGRFAEVKQATN
ncbi:hypothetical protein [Rhodoferax sp.]|uniref:hypothetical protein n=1 Tax=Rhodoferax sp. TaxID=50421 RepID=UPI001A0192C9|nr:hypothetical protein [Rhodoferax sp.]MBE0475171.1 hypothetical protein [Rhodoferax sp.]